MKSIAFLILILATGFTASAVETPYTNISRLKKYHFKGKISPEYLQVYLDNDNSHILTFECATIPVSSVNWALNLSFVPVITQGSHSLKSEDVCIQGLRAAHDELIHNRNIQVSFGENEVVIRSEDGRFLLD